MDEEAEEKVVGVVVYVECPGCFGRAEASRSGNVELPTVCARCRGLGQVQMTMSLDEFKKALNAVSVEA